MILAQAANNVFNALEKTGLPTWLQLLIGISLLIGFVIVALWVKDKFDRSMGKR